MDIGKIQNDDISHLVVKRMERIIAIGGLGGSGTRAVAQVLMNSGLFMGAPLNPSNDNLLFTQLFKNPAWFKQASIQELNSRFMLFEKLMKGTPISDPDYELWKAAAQSNPSLARKRPVVKKQDLAQRRVLNAGESWGWKEPNTHLFLDSLISFYPNLSYVHVLRHGLDMAFSDNHQQLLNWGSHLGIELEDTTTKEALANKQLEYWIKSTQRVLELGEKLGDRFLLLNYTDFCTTPNKEIDRLLSFCDLKLDIGTKSKLREIPQLPKSHNRYQQNDISIFTPEQLDFVSEMKFQI